MNKITFLFRRHILLVLLFLYFLYLLTLIFRSSYVIDHVRYFSLFDDEMVSMRYAHNLASGFGLVWNPGGMRVEGFTNPFWMLYMSLFHFVHIPLEKISFFIQLTGALCMVGTTVLVYKLCSIFGRSLLHANSNSVFPFLAAFFTATYFPLVNWNVIQGTEGALLTLFTLGAVYIVLITKKFHAMIYFLLGFGILTRMDFFVPTAIIWLYIIITQKNYRKQNILLGGGILVFFLMLLTTFRLWYYHDILPNTYYLKLTGYPILLRVIRGIYVTSQSVNLLIVAVAALPLVIKRNKALILFSSVIIGQFLYSMYVGGDAWEFYGGTNRYTTIVMPLFFVLFSLGLGMFWEMFVQYIKRSSAIALRVRGLKMTGIAGLMVIFISLNAVSDNTFLQMLLIKAPITTPDNAYNTYVAKTLERITTEDATIAVAWAGVIPYFADRTFIDLLGKNDKKIAHEPAKDPCLGEGDLRRLLCFKPGHMKWDYGYTIGHLQPDIVMQAYPLDAAKPDLDKNYTYDGKLLDMYVKNETQHVFINR